MCREAQIPEAVRLVLLLSDGVSDQVGHARMEALCRVHAADPQALADALAAAEADDEGYRDDATVIALAAAPASPAPGSHRG
jgi:serine/threonine protein phosphatase PrpC